jgi:hypothetical protein
MVEILSIYVWIWNTETCWNHVKKGNQGRGEIMEGMKQTRAQCMYMRKYHKGTPYITIIYYWNVLKMNKQVFLYKLNTTSQGKLAVTLYLVMFHLCWIK